MKKSRKKREEEKEKREGTGGKGKGERKKEKEKEEKEGPNYLSPGFDSHGKLSIFSLNINVRYSPFTMHIHD